MRTPRKALVVALVVGFGLGACATDDGPGVEPTDPGTQSPTTDSPTSPEPTDPGENGEPGDLPGEPTEIYPYEGDGLAVHSVEADDVLNVRSGPGVEFEVVAELAPLDDGMVATGHNRTIDDGSLWVELDADGVVGWANVAYLTQLGEVRDITSELDDLPTGDDMAELAVAVAGERAPVEGGGPEPTITLVDGPHSGDLAEATVDVAGFADDSVLGERLHVFATVDGDRFTVRTVESAWLCARGVGDEGLCV